MPKYVVNEQTAELAKVLKAAAELMESDGVPRPEYVPLIMGTVAIISGMLADNVLGATVVCLTEDEEGDEEMSQLSFATVKMSPEQMLAMSGRMHALAARIGSQALMREEQAVQERCQQEQEREGMN